MQEDSGVTEVSDSLHNKSIIDTKNMIQSRSPTIRAPVTHKLYNTITVTRA